MITEDQVIEAQNQWGAGVVKIGSLKSIRKECEIFARLVLPRLKTVSLPKVFGRVPNSAPNSPLANGERK